MFLIDTARPVGKTVTLVCPAQGQVWKQISSLSFFFLFSVTQGAILQAESSPQHTRMTKSVCVSECAGGWVCPEWHAFLSPMFNSMRLALKQMLQMSSCLTPFFQPIRAQHGGAH